MDPLFQFLDTKGKELFGDHFKIYPTDHEIILRMAVYFLNDKEASKRLDISIDKGIMLTGPIGCGKTSLMALMRLLLPPHHRFAIRSCREISFDFIKEGYEIIQKYGANSYSSARSPPEPINYCFDDLGAESSLKYFGNECNVMGEIILSRYDHFVSNGMLTHATTNLSASELETYYGNRVRSRMREMFNLIAFDSTSIDKRR